jgi:hypothetical protein
MIKVGEIFRTFITNIDYDRVPISGSDSLRLYFKTRFVDRACDSKNLLGRYTKAVGTKPLYSIVDGRPSFVINRFAIVPQVIGQRAAYVTPTSIPDLGRYEPPRYTAAEGPFTKKPSGPIAQSLVRCELLEKPHHPLTVIANTAFAPRDR